MMNIYRNLLYCLAIVSLSEFTLALSVFAEDAPDFNRDIRPILSNHCFQCHGQDEDTREAGLRLDVRSAAIEMGAIVPGSISQSELVERISSSDPDLVMPPPESNKPLSAKQIDLLKAWIATQAPYSNHWAFDRIEKPMVPGLPSGWSGVAHNEIDYFIAQPLAAKKLQSSPEADRTTLIRRLYQDVLGLLPSPREVDQFVADTSPNYYTNLVDNLLNSPHYGERWGRHWLDQARYADSNGYTIDGSRVMWPYRDWVIKAINDDMPFDQFTIEQLAGDLLPTPTKSQLVATAFHRNTMINEEGGVKADEFRHEATLDRVNTTGAVWLGLTLGCAQCHSHKFDPVSHDEYYQMYAFFNRAADANNVGKTVPVLPGELFGLEAAQIKRLEELDRTRAKLRELELKQETSGILPDIAWDWQQPEYIDLASESGTVLVPQKDGSLLATGDLARDGIYRIEIKGPAQNLSALRIRLLTDPSLPAKGPGRASNGNIVLTDASLEVASKSYRFSQAWADHSQPGHPVTAAIDDDSKSGWAINIDEKQRKQGKSMNSPHMAVFALESPLTTQGENIAIVLKHQLHETYQIGRFAIDISAALPSTADSGTQNNLAKEIDSLKKRIGDLEALVPGGGKYVNQMIMNEMPSPPETFRLKRGNFLTPAVEEGALKPSVPVVLVSGKPAAFQNRLDLARWLVSRDNPLTARVTVNRVWAKYFGRGLVETENDFGFQSSLTTHPELLDWLAAQFMTNGWSLKSLHRIILNSATYRQSSMVTPEILVQDPANYLLARQARFRVEAEIIRDQVLSASGLLNPDLGGPSVFPPQPDGVFDFTQRKLNWPTEKGDNRYRRTLYTTFYRSAPYPLLSTFDAPDFSTACTARVRSNSPLQSLSLANDPMFIELAMGLARSARIATVDAEANLQVEPPNQDAERSIPSRTIIELFRRCLSRYPDQDELKSLLAFTDRETDRFSRDPKQCIEFIGENSVELAAFTCAARLIMNTDEFVTRN